MTDSRTIEFDQKPLRLFAYGTGWGVPFETAAPFPLKLATWLRMARIPFEVVVENDASKGPKGKSPWIEYGDVRMGDSSLIIAHLRERFGINFEAQLDATERALALSVQRMLEEHYHQCFEQQLFFGRGGEARIAELAATMPFPLSKLLPVVVKRSFRKQLRARGMGRHSEEVIVEQGRADLDALSILLGERRYFFGDEPASVDATVFGFLGVTVYVEGDNPLFRHAAEQANLVRYTERMRARYFPETMEVRAPLVEDDSRAEGAPSAAVLRAGLDRAAPGQVHA